MGQETTPINPVRFYRQDSAPPAAPDGATWITESDGAANDTTSRYVRNEAVGRWELESAVGPSEPSLGVPVPGSTWRDTANAKAKQYDGSAFVTLGNTASELVAFGSTVTRRNTLFDGGVNDNGSVSRTINDEAISVSDPDLAEQTQTRQIVVTNTTGFSRDYSVTVNGTVVSSGYQPAGASVVEDESDYNYNISVSVSFNGTGGDVRIRRRADFRPEFDLETI
jgi:hypothetical protein